ncbi:hypothetical protein [Streptomyces sp. HUAS TT7]|uniref:hypothetical protein n=1 Tax=Streptomyces sp. HUAS TT7 TaxID=3447507 RepID=UPI003F65CF55
MNGVADPCLKEDTLGRALARPRVVLIMMEHSEATVKAWKVALPVRIAAVCVSLGFLAFAAWGFFDALPGDLDADVLMFTGAFLIVTAAGLLYSFRTSITLTTHRVIVQNLGLTNWVQIAEISAVTAGYSGTVITTYDGRTLQGLAVEKPNYARWLGRRTRADHVVNAIRSAAGLSNGPAERQL